VLIYQAWTILTDLEKLRGVCFYFGDERCVPYDHQRSNYGLVMCTLFNRGLPKECPLVRLEADLPDRDAAAMAYEQKLPRTLDVLLLSVGEDGHIASLFSHGWVLYETCRRVVQEWNPKPPTRMVHRYPTGFGAGREDLCVSHWRKKGSCFAAGPSCLAKDCCLPARLLLRATWLLDTPL
jgi:6-phosphogluconolactonase